jgi:hypothetical protein
MRLAEKEVMIAEALIGKSDDEVVNVFSRPRKAGPLVIEFLKGPNVWIEVRTESKITEGVIAKAILGKSDAICRVYSRPEKIGIIVVQLLNSLEVEIEVHEFPVHR